jgi:hypothetical protein
MRGKRNASQLGGMPPISALTYAFSIGSNRGHMTDDFGLRVVASRVTPKVVNRSDKPASAMTTQRLLHRSVAALALAERVNDD